MAREFARIKVNIWRDEDFCALPMAAKLLYLALVSAPKLTWCGTLDYSPKQLARIDGDMDPDRVEVILTILAERQFVLLDPDTDELAVRTFIRHDEVLRQPNVSRAAARALRAIVSDTVRGGLLGELRRLHAEDPDANGWAAFREAFPGEFSNPSGNPSPNPSGKGVSEQRNTLRPTPPSPLGGCGGGGGGGVKSPKVSSINLSDRLDLNRIQNATGGDESWARRVSSDVLDRAPAKPSSPTAYVLRAIAAEPDRYRPTATAPRFSLCEHGVPPTACGDCIEEAAR